MNRPQWLNFDPSAPFELGPRTFPGRVWTASGCFGYGLDGKDITGDGFRSPYEGIGCVVTKTITTEPRVGNPPPRLWDCGSGALNSIGLENVGVEKFLADVLPALADAGTPFLVSVAGTLADDFGGLARLIHAAAAGVPGWHGLELNLSCPNVAHGGVDFGRDPETVKLCVESAAAEIPDRTLLAKLTPNVGAMAPLAAAASAGGAHGVTAINTLIGMDIDLATGLPVLPRRRGGYSGPAILPVALAKVDEIVRGTGIAVVGVGGAVDMRDVLKFFAVGAEAVQIGTAQMNNPFAAAGIAAELAGLAAARAD